MIICVNNNKGGTLKTTTVTNLAGVLAAKKYKVLVIDADNQSNVAVTFGKNPDEYRTSLYDVLTSSLPAEDAIIKVNRYIDIIPSNDDLISFDFDVIGSPVIDEPFMIMKNKMNHLREYYDYILIDTPPSLGLTAGNVFAFSDRVLIPFTPETYSARSLIKVIDTIRDFKEGYNPELEVLGVLRTMVNMNTNLHIKIIEDVRKYAFENNITVFDTIIPRTVQFAKSVEFEEVPATMAKKKKQYDKSELFFELWNEIEQKLEKGSAVK